MGAVFVGGSPGWLNLPSSTAELDSAQFQKLGVISRPADSGTVIERAFCKGCGGTIGMWQAGTTEDERTRWLSIPLSNLRNFDWRSMLRDKSKVIQSWTSYAVDNGFVLEGYMACLEQVTRNREELARSLEERGKGNSIE